MEYNQLTLEPLHFDDPAQQKAAQDLSDFMQDAVAGKLNSTIVPRLDQQKGQSRASLRIIFCEAFLLQNGIQPKHLIEIDLTSHQARNVIAKYVYNRNIANPNDACRWLNYLRENPGNLTLYHIHVVNGMLSIAPIDETDVAKAVKKTVGLTAKLKLSLFQNSAKSSVAR